MAGQNSIQILRGGVNYNPYTSEEILLDGQPFYSKKTRKLYIGDGTNKIKDLDPINEFIEDLNIRQDTQIIFDGGGVDVTIAVLDNTVLL